MVFQIMLFLATLMSIILISTPFPVHHLGLEKDVTPQVERREHLLCWNVHIMTYSECAGENFKNSRGSHVIGNAEGGVQGIAGKPRRCGSSEESVKHARDVASELGLVIVRSYEEFHDHYLMCHVNDPGKLMKNSSLQVNISKIYEDHTHAQSRHTNAFFTQKREKEMNLMNHDEVFRFSQEFGFRRRSRLSLDDSPDLTAHFHRPQSIHKSGHHHVSHRSNSLRPLSEKIDENCLSAFHLFLSGFDSPSENANISQSVNVCIENVSEGLKNLSVSVKALTSLFQNCCHSNDMSNSSTSSSQIHHYPSTMRAFLNKLSIGTKASFNESNICLQLCRVFNAKVHPANVRHTRHLLRLFSKIHLQAEKCVNNSGEMCSELHDWAFISFQSLIDLMTNFSSTYLNDTKLKRNCLKLILYLKGNITRGGNIFKMIHTRRKRHIFSTYRDKRSKMYKDQKKFRHRRSMTPKAVEQVMRFNDPAFPRQWHLKNWLTPSMDINVTGVWMNNITGQGVTVAVVDDGVEWENRDLKRNYNYKGSWDFNDDDPDPSPSTKKKANHHGTRCAGEIAAIANNHVCGIGVAYGSKISGLRVLDGVMTDSMEASAFNKKMDINDIYSCSWGPDDDGKTVDGPHLMAAKAMKRGVDFGRQGYGSIFVVASGNGGNHQDNCNFDGYANSIYTVTIGAVDETGAMPYYAEECASMLGVTFSSGLRKRSIVTTDWTFKSSGCTNSHTGTSAAAPIAAGMIALMLSARPCLTWRDVQYILILTAEKIDVDLAHWQRNGAGLSHSHKHGFGLLTAWRMVNAARVWESVPWLTSFSYTRDLEADIPKGTKNPLSLTHAVRAEDIRGYGLTVLESVQVTVWLSHPCRGKLVIKIISPSKTVSVIAAARSKDNSTDGFQGWTFTTVRNWGESPIGNWTLEIVDKDVRKFGKGKLTRWRLTLFGTPMTREEFEERKRLVGSAMGGQFLTANHTITCPPPPEDHEEPAFLSEKTLKIVTLASAFCIVMAVYESFEYLCCYGEEKAAHEREMQARRNASRRANQHGASDAVADQNGLELTDVQTGENVADAAMSVRNDLNVGLGVGEDDDEEDDIFDASETRSLLASASSSRQAARNFSRFSKFGPANGDPGRLLSNVNGLSSEAIPLSTFHRSSDEANVVDSN